MECVFYRCHQDVLFVATFDDPETFENRDWPVCGDHWDEFTIEHLTENMDNVQIRKVDE